MKRNLILGAVVLVLLVGAVVGGAYAYFNHQIYSRVEGQYFTSDGVQIHYTDEGEGKPVILLHGFSVNADLQWRRVGITDALAENYRVISVDHRGHGLSDKPHDPDAYGEEFVYDVVGLMDHLGIEKAAVVGYSMGAMITLKMETMYPERMVCAVPCAFGWVKPEKQDTTPTTALAESLEAGEGFKPLVKNLTPEGEEFNEAEFEVINNMLMNLNDQQALAAVVRSWPEMMVTEEQLRNTEVPTLSIVGAKDPLREGIEDMEGVLPEHQIVLIEERDHMDAHMTGEFVDALVNFIDKHYEDVSLDDVYEGEKLPEAA